MDTKQLLFHGSSVPNLETLENYSKLHGSDQKRVVYLSGSIPYALVYIWSEAKTGTARKWVTSWIRDGIVYYEEQFPDQLRTFYEGVSGYIYCVGESQEIFSMPGREALYYSLNPVRVQSIMPVDDVYQELLRYEQEGKFRLIRFAEMSEERQNELTDRIVTVIKQENLLRAETEHAAFIRRHFTRAWENAMAELRNVRKQ